MKVQNIYDYDTHVGVRCLGALRRLCGNENVCVALWDLVCACDGCGLCGFPLCMLCDIVMVCVVLDIADCG